MDKEVMSKSVSKRLDVQNKDKTCETCSGNYVGGKCPTCNDTGTESKPDKESETREAFKKEGFHVPFNLRYYKKGYGIMTEDKIKEILFIGFKSGILLSPNFEMKAKNNMLNAHAEDLSNQLATAQQKAQAEIEELKIKHSDSVDQVQKHYNKKVKELEQQIEGMKYEKDFH